MKGLDKEFGPKDTEAAACQIGNDCTIYWRNEEHASGDVLQYLLFKTILMCNNVHWPSAYTDSSSQLWLAGVFAPTLFSKAYGSLVCDACTDSTGGNGTGMGPFICRNCHYDLVSEHKTNLRFSQSYYTPRHSGFLRLFWMGWIPWVDCLKNGCVYVSKLSYWFCSV